MLKTIILFLYTTLGGLSLGVAQESGIHFERDLNWQEVIDMAKAEHRYVFLEGNSVGSTAFKNLDSTIYSHKYIGDLVNSQFLSVNVGEGIVNLRHRYHLPSSTNWVFFSPDGNLLAWSTSPLSISKFINMVNFTKSPASLGFRKRLLAYQKGIRDYLAMPAMINALRYGLDEDELAADMTKKYFSNYLAKLIEPKKLLSRENLELAARNLQILSSKDNLIKGINNPANQSLLQNLSEWPGSASDVLMFVAAKEELEGKLCKKGNVLIPRPDWDGLKKRISYKYPLLDTALLFNNYCTDRNIFGLAFFCRSGDWTSLNRYWENQIKTFAQDNDDIAINRICFNVYFEQVTDCPSLKIAVKWIDTCLVKSRLNKDLAADDISNFQDTKASLYYKLGRRQLAIATETVAIKFLQNANRLADKPIEEGCAGFEHTLDLMNKRAKIDPLAAVYPTNWKLID